MVRLLDGANGGGRERAFKAFVRMLLLVAMTLSALQGHAEPAAAANPDNAGQAIDAQPLDLSFMGPASSARLVVRPQRMTQLSALAPVVDFIQSSLNASAAGDNLRAWRPRLETIDYYALQMRGTVDLSDAGAIKQVQGIAFAADLAIRFTDEDAGSDFWEWTKKTPNAEAVDGDGFSYIRIVQVPTADQIPTEALGVMCVAKRDERTFVIGDNVERLRRMVNGTSGVTAEASDRSTAPLAALDGGLLVAQGDKYGTQIGIQFLVEMAPHLQMFDSELGEGMLLLNDIQTVGFGVDLDPETNDFKLSAKVRCADEASAERVSAALARLQGFAKHQCDGMQPGLDPAQLAKLSASDRAAVNVHLFWTRLFAEASVKKQPTAGQAVELHLDASAPFPSLAGLLPPLQELAEPAPLEAK